MPILAILALVGAATAGPVAPTVALSSNAASPLDYGRPISRDDAIKIGEKFIKSDLLDPYSAHIDWPYNLVPFTEKVPFFKRTTGYATCVIVNAKNSYGGYVGERTYRLIFRDGNVIDYTQVSDLKIVGDICQELMTKNGMTEFVPNP